MSSDINHANYINNADFLFSSWDPFPVCHLEEMSLIEFILWRTEAQHASSVAMRAGGRVTEMAT